MLEDEDAGLDEDEFPDEADGDDDDESDGQQCPECGRWFAEDCACCPSCGHWVSEEDPGPPPATGFRVVWTLAVVLVILAMLWWVIAFR